MLTKSEDMKAFLKLVDSNATVKQYKNTLGFDGGDVRIHIKFIPYYRTYIKMANEILELSKKKKGSSVLEKAKISIEIRKVRTKYREILNKLKAGQ